MGYDLPGASSSPELRDLAADEAVAKVHQSRKDGNLDSTAASHSIVPQYSSTKSVRVYACRPGRRLRPRKSNWQARSSHYDNRELHTLPSAGSTRVSSRAGAWVGTAADTASERRANRPDHWSPLH